MGDTQKNPPVHPESGIVHDWLIYKQREKRYMQISDESEPTRSSREEWGAQADAGAWPVGIELSRRPAMTIEGT